jgi:transposase-like protein
MTHEEALNLQASITKMEKEIEVLEAKIYLETQRLKRDCPHKGKFDVHKFRPNRDGSQFEVKICHICLESFDRKQLK